MKITFLGLHCYCKADANTVRKRKMKIFFFVAICGRFPMDTSCRATLAPSEQPDLPLPLVRALK
jgi:hypothetical protein